MKVVAPYTEFRTAGLFRSTAVSTGLALKCEVVCQGYLYAGIAGDGVWDRFSYYTLVLVKKQ